MECSEVGYQGWIIAMFLVSMKLRRDIGVTQNTEWFLGHHIRDALSQGGRQSAGRAEVGEMYFGSKEKNKHDSRRLKAGRGPVGKTAVVGAEDRETKKVAAKVVTSTDKETLQGFVADNAANGAKLYIDDAQTDEGMQLDHDTVKHSLQELQESDKVDVHANRVESLWSKLKRAHKGRFRKLSPKHLGRYVQEFAGQHNVRQLDTVEQLAGMVAGMEGRRLRRRALARDNGMSLGARAG